MPRGLYAMVMAFKDEVPGQQPRGPLSKLAGASGKTLFTTQRLDINQTVAKYSNPDPEMSKLKKGLKDIRLVSGKTYTALELPEAAALIYPDLDRLVDNDLRGQDEGIGKGIGKGKGKDADSGGVKDKLKGAGAWVQDYLDRKAQAAYVSAGQLSLSLSARFANIQGCFFSTPGGLPMILWLAFCRLMEPTPLLV